MNFFPFCFFFPEMYSAFCKLSNPLVLFFSLHRNIYIIHCSYIRSCQLLDFNNCNNLVVSNIKLRNGPRRHLAFHGCTNLTVSQITVTAPGNSPNTDGINIAESQHVQIIGSTFATGTPFILICLCF
jgi:polygalacturonase